MSTQAPAPASRGPQIVIVLGVTLVVSLVLVFLFAGRGDSVRAKMTAYAVVGQKLSVTFEVNKAYIAEATCSIVALDKGYNVVGRQDGYVVGPQADHHRVTVHTVEIPVTGVPVTGRVDSCVITRNH